jgi:hypothetical protein
MTCEDIMEKDRFMFALQGDPAAAFADSLQERLAARERVEHDRARIRRWSVAAAAVVLMSGSLVFPGVRASAQAFLNLFRVVNITAVPVRPERFDEFADRGLDIGKLIGEEVQVVGTSGPPQVFAMPEQATQAAGFTPKVPDVLPDGLTMLQTEVMGEHVVGVKGNVALVQYVLDTLGIRDIQPPPGLDGQVLSARLQPMVRIVYVEGDAQVSVVQARSPEVVVPDGVDLAALGEIGLRVLGMGQLEAHTLAQAIDWRNTLVVPVPAGLTTFRQVSISGARGLLVSAADQSSLMKLLVWSDGTFVYGISGPLREQTIVLMAESLR